MTRNSLLTILNVAETWRKVLSDLQAHVEIADTHKTAEHNEQALANHQEGVRLGGEKHGQVRRNDQQYIETRES